MGMNVQQPAVKPVDMYSLTALYCYSFLSRENRYLLFLTENYAALDILRHYLQDTLSCISEGSMHGDAGPFILFGSSFPRDMEYTQVRMSVHAIVTLVSAHSSTYCYPFTQYLMV